MIVGSTKNKGNLKRLPLFLIKKLFLFPNK